MVSLRHRLFPRTRETGQETVAQHSRAHVSERVEDRPLAPAGEQKNLSCPDCVRTQNQKLEAMLKLMISPPVGRLIMAQPGGTVQQASDSQTSSPAD